MKLAKLGAWVKQRLQPNAIGGLFFGALACLGTLADVRTQVRIQELVKSHLALVIAVTCLYAAAELFRAYRCRKSCKSAQLDGLVWMSVGFAAAAPLAAIGGIMPFSTMVWAVLIGVGAIVLGYKLDEAAAAAAQAEG